MPFSASDDTQRFRRACSRFAQHYGAAFADLDTRRANTATLRRQQCFSISAVKFPQELKHAPCFDAAEIPRSICQHPSRAAPETRHASIRL